jgi:hypothetical protein
MKTLEARRSRIGRTVGDVRAVIAASGGWDGRQG